MRETIEDVHIQRSKAHVIVEIVEYIPNTIVRKTIIKKTLGSITTASFDIGKEFCEEITRFDYYVQIIDGFAEVVINNKSFELRLGAGIVIPANSTYCFYATQQFKMICTIIKSIYKDS